MVSRCDHLGTGEQCRLRSTGGRDTKRWRSSSGAPRPRRARFSPASTPSSTPSIPLMPASSSVWQKEAGEARRRGRARSDWRRRFSPRIGEGRGGCVLPQLAGGPGMGGSASSATPAFLQLGGTGPQAAWALATLGAPAIVALTDRSDEQVARPAARCHARRGGRAGCGRRAVGAHAATRAAQHRPGI